jgi:hypothetical protein
MISVLPGLGASTVAVRSCSSKEGDGKSESLSLSEITMILLR